MSASNKNAIDVIPTLKGNGNYASWVKLFRVWCDAEDDEYWPIYTGELQPEMETLIQMSDTKKRNRCAAEHGIHVDQITAAQLREWTQDNITDPNERFRAWKKKNAIVLRTIFITTSPIIHGIVGEERYASNVNAKLIDAFGRPTFEAWFSKYLTLTNLVYKPDMSPLAFVSKFNIALEDKKRCEPPGNESSSLYHYCMFIRAVRAHGDMDYWVQKELQRDDGDIHSPKLLKDAISSFLNAETYRYLWQDS